MDSFINKQLSELKAVAQAAVLLEKDSSVEIDWIGSCEPMPIDSALPQPLKQKLWCLLTSAKFAAFRRVR